MPLNTDQYFPTDYYPSDYYAPDYYGVYEIIVQVAAQAFRAVLRVSLTTSAEVNVYPTTSAFMTLKTVVNGGVAVAAAVGALLKAYKTTLALFSTQAATKGNMKVTRVADASLDASAHAASVKTVVNVYGDPGAKVTTKTVVKVGKTTDGNLGDST